MFEIFVTCTNFTDLIGISFNIHARSCGIVSSSSESYCGSICCCSYSRWKDNRFIIQLQSTPLFLFFKTRGTGPNYRSCCARRLDGFKIVSFWMGLHTHIASSNQRSLNLLRISSTRSMVCQLGSNVAAWMGVASISTCVLGDVSIIPCDSYSQPSLGRRVLVSSIHRLGAWRVELHNPVLLGSGGAPSRIICAILPLWLHQRRCFGCVP